MTFFKIDNNEFQLLSGEPQASTLHINIYIHNINQLHIHTHTHTYIYIYNICLYITYIFCPKMSPTPMAVQNCQERVPGGPVVRVRLNPGAFFNAKRQRTAPWIPWIGGRHRYM